MAPCNPWRETHPQEFARPFFVAVFFRITHDGQSERGCTRSLLFELPSPGDKRSPSSLGYLCGEKRAFEQAWTRHTSFL